MHLLQPWQQPIDNSHSNFVINWHRKYKTRWTYSENLSQPNNIGVQSPQWALQLGSLPPCPSRLQGRHLQSTGCTWMVGVLRHRRLVFGAFGWRLPVKFVLCAVNASIPHLGIGQTLPTTLSCPKSKLQCTSQSIHRGVADKNRESCTFTQTTPLLQKSCKGYQSHPNAHKCGGTKGGHQRCYWNPPSDNAPILTIQQISDAPSITQTRDPTAKQNLITAARIHHRQTQNNTPGALPKITQAAPALIQPDLLQLNSILRLFSKVAAM